MNETLAAAPDAQPVLEVDIRHRAGSFSLAASFTVASRGVTALFGHSGAGKSMVLSAIAGHLRPDAGTIRLGEDTVFDSARGHCTPPEQRGLGCVFQQPLLFPHLRVRDNCLFGARRAVSPPTTAQIDRVLSLLDLNALLKRYPHHLSGGEAQRVAMARALLCQPRMLLLDEPMSAIDDSRKRDVLPYLERLRDEAGVPIVYVSHALNEVTRLAERVVVFENGRVSAHGPADEILSSLGAVPGTDAGALIAATIARHADDEQLSYADFDGGVLVLPRIDAPVGKAVRLFVHARDVMLSLHALKDVSANNVLPATVTELHDRSHAGIDVQVRCGATDLVARLTRHSVKRLRLQPGDAVFAVIKTVQLRQ